MGIYKTLEKNVTTAGTPEKVSDEPLNVVWFTMIAKADNSGNIYPGGSDVDDNAWGLEAGKMFRDSVSNGAVGSAINLNNLWIDADTSGEGVVITCRLV